jgi:hypothetical protein
LSIVTHEDFITRILTKSGFSKNVSIPLKVISNVQATLQMVLPKDVKGVAVIYNPEDEQVDLFKNTIAKIRPNSFVMRMMDSSSPRGFVTLFYK